MKNIVYALTFLILGNSCYDKQKTKDTAAKDSISISIRPRSDLNKTSPKTINGVIYETENVRLYGDSTIDRSKISHAYLKFELYIGFEDFPVDKIDHEKYANLDLKSNNEANNFRTNLREGYRADTANFAGHYSFVFWGCGSPCQSSLLIDRKTGKIYDSPSASVGYDFKVSSRMLIVNPPDTSGFYFDCSHCKPIIYLFDEKTKTFRELRARKP
ncbi:hypothetical protein [Solitalea longa]|nr:hypothetical protein [Solitalea longa]